MPPESPAGTPTHILLIGRDVQSLDTIAEYVRESPDYTLTNVGSIAELRARPEIEFDAVIAEQSELFRSPEWFTDLPYHHPDALLLVLSESDTRPAGVDAGNPDHISPSTRMQSDDSDTTPVHIPLCTPVRRGQLEVVLRLVAQIRALRLQNRALKESLAEQTDLGLVIARSGSMRNIIHSVEKACKNDISVLLEGEEGTGKEYFARTIHYNGTRGNGPFVMLSCSTIPNHLIENELFGHEAGCYGDGDEVKQGVFEQAEHGTLFIDEIGELDISLQGRLYRVIQTKSFRRLGGDSDIPTNVRIISATAQDLRRRCTAGTFREDLYYRLASFPIRLPALRERVADIPLLADYYLRMHAEKIGRPGLTFSNETKQILRRYSWPGNNRELEHSIERAVVLTDTMEIRPVDLPPAILSALGMEVESGTEVMLTGSTATIPSMDQLKARGVRLALETTGGNVFQAARLLRIGRTTIYKLMKRYNIKI
ncbi:MAG: sigma-54-dependent Fis family transcriptional regulator [Bacteroidetes bacterium]|nr:sigma-54-dependent Fis family transcriptional regulator [Bacteroidota bacterium]